MLALAARFKLRYVCSAAFLIAMVATGAARSAINALEAGEGEAVAAVNTRASITRAIDGDTIEVRTAAGRTRDVRLIGIDTPETVRPGVAVECGGPAASKSIRRFVGQSVRLFSDPTQDQVDRYGRLLRYVVTLSGVDVGQKQVAGGHAAVYVYDEPFRRLPAYQRAADTAEAGGRGVWGSCGGDFHSAG